MRNIYLHIDELKMLSGNLALATVISTTGSTPQKPGNSALFDTGGLISGTVGGGVLEARVQEIAVKAAMTKISGIYTFDLNRDISFKSEAICGGRVTLIVDGDPSRWSLLFIKAREAIRERISCVMATRISGEEGSEISFKRDIYLKEDVKNAESAESQKIMQEVNKLLNDRNPEGFSFLDITGGKEVRQRIFLEPLFPPDKLVIAGAGHIGRALCHYGKRLGFEVTVIDDRPEFSNALNLPDADKVLVSDIGQAIGELEKESDTFIVIVTRGHNDDAKALRGCIRSPAAYIGMIGSRTKIAKMREVFISNGWATEDEWSAIHSPVGLDILSKTVEEIALSIAAEMVLVRNSRNGGDE